jgi:tetratricopeptide (TPR) repeat protein
MLGAPYCGVCKTYASCVTPSLALHPHATQDHYPRGFARFPPIQKPLAFPLRFWYFTRNGGADLARKRHKLSKKEIKEDKVAEFFLGTAQFVRENSRRIAGVVLVALVVVVIVTMAMRQRRAAEAEAGVWVWRANMEAKAGNIASAMQSYGAVIERFRGTWGHSDANFFLANIQFATGRYDSALVLFETYLSLGKRRDEFTVSSKEGVAQCLEEMGRYREAAESFLKVQREHPESPLAADALLGAARCYSLAGDLRAAESAYNDLLELYPDSSQSTLAKMLLMETQAKLENPS